MEKAAFVFFFAVGLLLLYLTIVVEHQFLTVGLCR
jgi:hypothetical protein